MRICRCPPLMNSTPSKVCEGRVEWRKGAGESLLREGCVRVKRGNAQGNIASAGNKRVA